MFGGMFPAEVERERLLLGKLCHLTINIHAGARLPPSWPEVGALCSEISVAVLPLRSSAPCTAFMRPVRGPGNIYQFRAPLTALEAPHLQDDVNCCGDEAKPAAAVWRVHRVPPLLVAGRDEENVVEVELPR